MKLYQVSQGTNPRRVGIYLAEKGIDIERVEVDVANSEQRSPAFLAMNPAGQVPVLALDDGTFISESAAIVEYFEELYPDPPMIGAEPGQRGRVRALERIVAELILQGALWLQHSHGYFASRFDQQPAAAAVGKAMVERTLDLLEKHIGDKPYLAGDQPTVPDCSLFALTQTCRERLKIPFLADRPVLDAWYARFAERPSAAY